MAAQTEQQRKAAARKAAATRKRNQARASAQSTRTAGAPDRHVRADHGRVRAEDRRAGRRQRRRTVSRPLSSRPSAPC